MTGISLQQLAQYCGGSLIKGTPSALVSSLSTDSRSLAGKDVFLALKGDNFDGHKFIGEADKQGVSCIVVSSLLEETETSQCAIIHVRDTLLALQNLAAAYRISLKENFAVGVTGSNGKTTTKDFLCRVLSVAGDVNATKGNLNNHIGLPLTVLDTDSSHRFGVWEMGMNHPGEIEVLTEIAKPDAAVITNIGTAHIEHMKSREAIAEEKACLAKAIPEAGYCVMPEADPFFAYVSDNTLCRMISVGIDEGDVRASNIQMRGSGGFSFDLKSRDCEGSYQVELPVRGQHMVINALLAVAVGIEQGISLSEIAKALSDTVLTGGRLEEKKVNGINFLDDSYNANPDSMRAALSVLIEAPVMGRRVAVLGFMGELGETEKQEHVSIGGGILKDGIDILVTVGERASVINEGAEGMADRQMNFGTHEEASDFLRENLTEGDLVLLKGSRAAGMEKVLEFLNQ